MKAKSQIERERKLRSRFLFGVYLAASILLHSVWLLGIENLKPLKPEGSKTSSPEPIEFVVKETAKSTSRTSGKVQRSGGAKLFTKGLLPQLNSSSASADPNGIDDASVSGGWGKDDWGVGGGDFKKIENYLLYKKVWDSVDGILFYPGILARREIQGTVHVRFILNPNGECNWEKTKILSKQAYLRVYVLDLMAKTCKINFKPWQSTGKEVPIDLSFRFAITEDNDRQKQLDDQIIVGNVMTFHRHSHQSVMEWHLGPIKGIFPIPFVAVDFDWLKEQWSTIIDKQDPLQEFRSRAKAAFP